MYVKTVTEQEACNHVYVKEKKMKILPFILMNKAVNSRKLTVHVSQLRNLDMELFVITVKVLPCLMPYKN